MVSFLLRSLRGTRLRVLSALLLGGLTGLRAAEPTASDDPVSTTRIARSITEFWNLKSENPQLDLGYDLTCDVLYYNPNWHIMWIQEGDNPFFASPGAAPRSFTSGDRVRFRGVVRAPVYDLDLSQAKAEVVGQADEHVVPLLPPGEDITKQHDHLVTFEAWVDQQETVDGLHVRLKLSTLGRAITAQVTLNTPEVYPRLVDRRVQVTGVLAPRQDPTGEIVELQVMVDHEHDIIPVGFVYDDPRFAAPVRPIADLADMAEGQTVRLRGSLISQSLGETLTVRDESGQVTLPAAQVRQINVGDIVELVGVLSHTALNPTLHQVSFRRPSDSDYARQVNARNSQLNLSARVRELPESEWETGHLADLRGVVTWSLDHSRSLFVQDSSGGIEVLLPPGARRPMPGTMVEVLGSVTPGEFGPVVQASDIFELGALAYPAGPDISLERALSGTHDAQWVTLHGSVFEVIPEPDSNLLRLSTDQGDFTVVVAGSTPLQHLLHSLIEVQGVCQTVANPQRQLESIRLLAPDAALIQVTDPAPADPFALEALPVAQLGRFNPRPQASDFVKVEGTVIFHRPGHWLYLNDGEQVLRVQTRETGHLLRGHRIQVAGRLGRERHDIVLREGLLRDLGEGELPAALPLTADRIQLEPLEGHLIAVHGTLLNLLETPHRLRYTLQNGAMVVEAELLLLKEEHAPSEFTRPEIGSQVRVEGVLVPPPGGGGPTNVPGLMLALSTPDDVKVLSAPPWWTSQRLANVAFALVAALGLGLLWVRVLRRRVQRQTAVIKEQLTRETRLSERLQHATRLESLGLLAGGIAHDFNNLLTVVLGNLSLLRLDVPPQTEAESSLNDAEAAVSRARQLTMQLLTFAKGGAPVRGSEDLPGIVREVTQFVLRGTGVHCDLQLSPDAWPAHVDKGQIAQVVQNLVINATQAMDAKGHLSITLTNVPPAAPRPPTLFEGSYLCLEITDTGCGIPAHELDRIFDPYFSTKNEGHGLGLATVYSIVRKHQGDIEVSSVVGQGTTFRIWLPAAPNRPSPAKGSAHLNELPRGQGERILVMDDDPAIRKVAEKMLLQLGYAPTCVADGLSALEAYHQAETSHRPFTATILDLTVPGGMGGAETLTRLRQHNPHFKAIVSSGYSSDRSLSAYREHGFDDLIPKPYELAKFATVLARVVASTTNTSAHA